MSLSKVSASSIFVLVALPFTAIVSVSSRKSSDSGLVETAGLEAREAADFLGRPFAAGTSTFGETVEAAKRLVALLLYPSAA
jgi:hypothetical protein